MARWHIELEATDFQEVDADTEREAVDLAIMQASQSPNWKPLFTHRCED